MLECIAAKNMTTPADHAHAKEHRRKTAVPCAIRRRLEGFKIGSFLNGEEGHDDVLEGGSRSVGGGERRRILILLPVIINQHLTDLSS